MDVGLVVYAIVLSVLATFALTILAVKFVASRERQSRPPVSVIPPDDSVSGHVVGTTHIQQMLLEAYEIAKALDRVPAGSTVELPQNKVPKRVEYSICRAVNLAQHAAGELEDERLRCYGWR